LVVRFGPPLSIAVCKESSSSSQEQWPWVVKQCHVTAGAVEKMKIAPLLSWALAAVILAGAAALVGWLERDSLRRKAADLWVVADRLTRADAIVVLGGNSQTRPPVAADLYRRGVADKVLVSDSDYQLNRAALLKLGIPASAIEAFGKANKNTRDEAVALREWAERNGASVFVIPSEPFMTRRVRWIFRREFSGRPVTIEVQPFEPPHYSHEGWWRTEQGSLAFQNEIVKYLYYRWKY
jgi:uncharacterized SAM-binding protein YcdF (DUF218 family)